MKWLAFCGLFIAVPAAAEINGTELLSYAVADAELIVSGTVSNTREIVTKRGAKYEVVQFKVARSYKGGRRKLVTFYTQAQYNPPSSWGKATRILFLKKSKPRKWIGKPFASWMVRFAAFSGYGVIDPKKDTIYTADMRVVSGAQAIERALRKAIKNELPLVSPQAFRWEHGNNAVTKHLWAGSAVWIYLPVDKNLEKRAIQWFKTGNIHDRVAALQALSHFRSPHNVRLFRAALSDNTSWVMTSTMGPQTRVYPVRAEAYKVLTQWGYKVKKPVTRETIVRKVNP